MTFTTTVTFEIWSRNIGETVPVLFIYLNDLSSSLKSTSWPPWDKKLEKEPPVFQTFPDQLLNWIVTPIFRLIYNWGLASHIIVSFVLQRSLELLKPLSLWHVFVKLWAQFIVDQIPHNCIIQSKKRACRVILIDTEFSVSRIEGFLFDFPSRSPVPPSRLRAQFRDQRGWKLGLKPGRAGCCNLCNQHFNCS